MVNSGGKGNQVNNTANGMVRDKLAVLTFYVAGETTFLQF
jgi:hypothetical protein